MVKNKQFLDHRRGVSAPRKNCKESLCSGWEAPERALVGATLPGAT